MNIWIVTYNQMIGDNEGEEIVFGGAFDSQYKANEWAAAHATKVEDAFRAMLPDDYPYEDEDEGEFKTVYTLVCTTLNDPT